MRRVSLDDLPVAATLAVVDPLAVVVLGSSDTGRLDSPMSSRQHPFPPPQVAIITSVGAALTTEEKAASITSTSSSVVSPSTSVLPHTTTASVHDEPFIVLENNGPNKLLRQPHLETKVSCCCSRRLWEEEQDHHHDDTTSADRPLRWMLFLRCSLLVLLVTILAVVVVQVLVRPALPHQSSPGSVEPHSICVSGGGFSGFWFTLGRLESLTEQQLQQSSFYCYSAGCLGVVARMQQRSLREMRDMAYSTQQLWTDGTITRYQVVEQFVDQLLVLDASAASSSDGGGAAASGRVDFTRLNVLTTTTTSSRNDNDDLWPSVGRTSIRTPTSVQQLRTLLIQSAWIPMATGGGLWHHDHMDGAFSLPQHPVCEKHVGLILDWELLANVVNVNLGLDALERLFQRGLAYGV